MELEEESITINNFEDVYRFCSLALNDVAAASNLMFELEIRSKLKFAIEEAKQNMEGHIQWLRRYSAEESQLGEEEDALRTMAGLKGAQLEYKFYEIELSANDYHNSGGIEKLSTFFKKSVILLKSLAGIVPLLGSSLQELIDFILERLKELSR